MAFHYGNTPPSNPITAQDDVKYMEARWARLAPVSRVIVVQASLVSIDAGQRAALGLATDWRYDIGEARIECLFLFENHGDVFLENAEWNVLSDVPAPPTAKNSGDPS